MTGLNSPGVFVQVINLARRPDRLAQVSAELNQAGLDFETQVAVDGQIYGYESDFVSRGEIGCWKSHLNAMRRLVEEKFDYSLILEDDATLSRSVNVEYLSGMVEVMKRNQLDMLQIGFIEEFYLPSLRSGILEFFISLLKNRGTKDSSGVRFVLGEFRAGTHAYIVNSRLADAISANVSDPPPNSLGRLFRKPCPRANWPWGHKNCQAGEERSFSGLQGTAKLEGRF